MPVTSFKALVAAPLVGVGPIRFGMSREEVRAAVGTPFRVAPPTDFALERDQFLDPLLMVHYDAAGRCGAVELPRGTVDLLFEGKRLFEQSASDVLAWARSTDPGITVKDGFVSPALGLSMWADWLGERDEDQGQPAASFMVFRDGFHAEERARVSQLLRARMKALGLKAGG